MQGLLVEIRVNAIIRLGPTTTLLVRPTFSYAPTWRQNVAYAISRLRMTKFEQIECVEEPEISNF